MRQIYILTNIVKEVSLKLMNILPSQTCRINISFTLLMIHTETVIHLLWA